MASTVRMPCLVASTRLSRVAVTKTRSKSERRGDEGESEEVEGRSGETNHVPANGSQPCGSGKGPSARLYFLGEYFF